MNPRIIAVQFPKIEATSNGTKTSNLVVPQGKRWRLVGFGIDSDGTGGTTSTTGEGFQVLCPIITSYTTGATPYTSDLAFTLWKSTDDLVSIGYAYSVPEEQPKEIFFEPGTMLRLFITVATYLAAAGFYGFAIVEEYDA